MINIIRKLLLLLSRKEKKQLIILVFFMSLISLIEVAGVGSIMPFIAVVTNPQIIFDNRVLQSVYDFFSFSDTNQFVIFVGFTVLFVLIVTNLSNVAANWMIFRFSWTRNYTISKRMLEKYIYLPYEFFLVRNTSDIRKNIIEEVRMVVVGVLNQLLLMIKNAVFTMAVVCMIFLIDPILAFIVSTVLGGAYLIIFRFIYGRLKRAGKIRSKSNRMRFKAAEEAFNSIKSLKILGREQYFIDEFNKHSLRFSKSQANKSIISQFPRQLFEIIIFGTIIIIILYFLVSNIQTDNLLPILSLYAFAGYRLMPALQRIFSGATEIRFSSFALDNLVNDLLSNQKAVDLRYDNREHIENNGNRLILNRSIDIEIKSFSYPGQKEILFNNLSLSIKANSLVGFIGSTGAGKTTLLDIVLGLLHLENGSVEVDGKKLTDQNINAWQNNIGYVPQDIFLVDDTIIKNIAFGVEEKNINYERLKRYAEIANIHDFIMNELAEQYQTTVGERGVRLSGGQRQRLGIARALYHEPQVLVFDEATNALDNVTENQVMNSIAQLSGDKTILMIAHRLSTLRNCDVIYLLEQGRIASSGTYDELKTTCNIFNEKENHL
jgi:ATP-binding cassette, subfamily B, bacterial PglK